MGDGILPLGHAKFNQRAKLITFSYNSVAENVAYISEGFSDIP